jgi:hypothetical protein
VALLVMVLALLLLGVLVAVVPVLVEVVGDEACTVEEYVMVLEYEVHVDPIVEKE